ncbi:MAG: SWF/SNF helicase family protein [Sulfuritalea sp.]|nr:SWF/SNF helicase family protein [Sulfuritalea sp.]
MDGAGAASTKATTEAEIVAIKAEISELESFRNLAVSITETLRRGPAASAQSGVQELDELGAAKKAIVFTESRRTQDYLLKLLADGIRPRCRAVQRHQQRPRRTSGPHRMDSTACRHRPWFRAPHRRLPAPHSSTISATIPARWGLYRHRGRREGINLQFCSMVINYDLPWNPQRIEQRIGRCHRYGQKHDVVVAQLPEPRLNEADRRVHQLLRGRKFQRFDGVGASDEVLGAGVRRRFRSAGSPEIYQTRCHPGSHSCRLRTTATRSGRRDFRRND